MGSKLGSATRRRSNSAGIIKDESPWVGGGVL
jgi:hypothetical protein